MKRCLNIDLHSGKKMKINFLNNVQENNPKGKKRKISETNNSIQPPNMMPYNDTLRIVFQNINGKFNENVNDISYQIHKAQADVVCLQETKIKEEEEQFVNLKNVSKEFIIKMSNLSLLDRQDKLNKNGKEVTNKVVGSEGLLTMVNKKWQNNLLFKVHPNKRIISTIINNEPKNIWVIHNIYAPNKCNENEAFLKDLTEWNNSIKLQFPKMRKNIIFIGDFNATMEKSEFIRYGATTIVNSPYKNQDNLIDFIETNKFINVGKNLQPNVKN